MDYNKAALEESTHQEQERTLRLMEIGDQHLHNLILIARSNKSGNKGKKVGIAYQLENGEIIYVPEDK